MLVFNCTKSAAEFFTKSKKGEKISPIETAPHKTIADSIAAENSLVKNDLEQSNWHWLVHVITVKRKKAIIVTDFNSRFSMTFTGLKKGDEIAFLNMFEHHLTIHVRQLMEMVVNNSKIIDDSIEQYYEMHFECAFHQRGDRSVQATINDVAWYFEEDVHDKGQILEDYELVKFDYFVNNLLRKSKQQKDYFQPYQLFLQQWLTLYSEQTAQEIQSHLTALSDAEKELFNRQLAQDSVMEMEEEQQQTIDNLIYQDNIIDFESFRKKK